MTIKILNIIMENLTVLGISNLTMKELNNIGEFLVERNINNINDAKDAVKQYLASK